MSKSRDSGNSGCSKELPQMPVVHERQEIRDRKCQMENYTKGKNVEEALSRDSVPFENLPNNYLWMHLTGASRMRNILDHALSCLDKDPVVVWSGSGPALQKVISCVEVVKRKYPMHQVTRLCYRKVEEHWDPQLEGLEPIVVYRDIPVIHVLLSKEPLYSTQLGYQAPVAVGEKKNPSRHSADPSKAKPKRPRSKKRAEKLKQYTKKED